MEYFQTLQLGMDVDGRRSTSIGVLCTRQLKMEMAKQGIAEDPCGFTIFLASRRDWGKLSEEE
ncbi:MAG TPA: hypothetical protein PLL18_17825 [Flavobacteriales bacterium]|nr:hypothetical protein [Flavobacteriales bacterium]